MVNAVLGSGLLVQSLALLQLCFSVEELGLRLVPLRLDVDELIVGSLELSPGLVQLPFGLLELGIGLLQLSRQLVLSGAHIGGDFEQLTSTLLQRFQLVGEKDKCG